MKKAAYNLSVYLIIDYPIFIILHFLNKEESKLVICLREFEIVLFQAERYKAVSTLVLITFQNVLRSVSG